MTPFQSLNQQVAGLLGRFNQGIRNISDVARVEKLAESIYVLHPKASNTDKSRQKLVDLTFTGSIHGNEPAGLGVLVALVERLTHRLNQSDQALDLTLGLAIGHPAAALKGERFLERDLNRSFAREATNTVEDQRAAELEILLKQTQHLLDFHQVRMPTTTPFWIFPYTKSGFEFARLVAPQVPIVTHWSGGFSGDGQCSDEFVNKQGGIGVSIELGQNGLDEAQINLGVEAALSAMHVVSEKLKGLKQSQENHSKLATIDTWAAVVPHPPTSFQVLDSGWSNFVDVKQGDRLGEHAGQVIKAPVSGKLLFPKYPMTVPGPKDTGVAPAAELVRILKEIDEIDLPG
jgi:hypothetical protein